ncbi:adenosylcobinamide-GDP ribazoletransferase [Psychromonas marina]|uniref:Adenosylcobinamide-GDP ribazoletransferase n=1 Tax=Psychromonas marina TaxID=88364 RepID=A0ABQ6DWW1_9GAMM|nr:adenosylcobinamide-GDP ribazoletransferase [Psychromonas marina]GLS89642.1 adenosylcobinamide-GDP ribazoletransferase [Psychromonas marina]
MNIVLQNLRQQLILFFYALSYFTRVPIPRCIDFDDEQFHKANVYLPLIGLGVALVMGGIFYVSQLIFSIPISLILMLIGGLLLTGALHEDGFADCCDGFGGGYNAAQRLKIMKDSQIGSYAGIGLVVLFILKLNVLIELTAISYSSLFIALLLAHTLSRYAALFIMQTLPYVRLDKQSKVQSLATKLPQGYFIFASLCALSSLLLLSPANAVSIVAISVIATFILRQLFLKSLQGYTGDCLGFAQQCIELIILLLLTVVLQA